MSRIPVTVARALLPSTLALADVTLIDKSDAVVFGYSKLDVNGGCVW